MVQVTKADGTKATMSGGMNDKIFARLSAAYGWVAYKIIPDPEYAMTDSDRALKDYCDSHDRIIDAMNK